MQKMSPLGLAYANLYHGPTDHAWLVSELQTQLASDPSAQSLSDPLMHIKAGTDAFAQR